jgi:hypothetical protein
VSQQLFQVYGLKQLFYGPQCTCVQTTANEHGDRREHFAKKVQPMPGG